MPGHKGGAGIPENLWNTLIRADVTEIPGMDNLYRPQDFIARALERCSEIFGTVQTFFSVNGSTAGIHAAMEAIAGDRKEIIMSRDCHKAVYNQVILGGYTPYYVPVGFDPKTLTPSLATPSDIADAMDKTGCKTVIITGVNYYGMVADIQGIAREVHKRSGILIVDEAHGAHFKFSKSLPDSAIDCGADIVIQSAHKTLPVINQGAYIHVASHRADPEKINTALSMIQTSSPSYIIMGLLEYAALYLHTYGDVLYNKLCKDIDALAASVSGENDIHIKSDICIHAVDKDKTRILLDAYRAGFTGYRLENRLRQEHNIAVEAVDLYNCTLIAAACDPAWYFDRLYEALKNGAIADTKSEPKAYGILSIPDTVLLPCEAVRKESKNKKPDEAIGSVARRALIPYPPGIPLIVPGERITKEAVEYIKAVINEGGFIEGIEEEDGNIYINVVK
jgi:arginine decarboxylase